MKLQLVQPGRRRSWDLRHGNHVLATLSMPAFRRGAEIEVGGLRLAVEADGLIRDTATGEERARIGGESLHPVLELNGERTEWRPLGRGSAYGFVDPHGEPLVRGRLSPGPRGTSGEIEVTDELPRDQALLAAALAAYLLIRKADDNASAAASMIAATF